MKVRKTPCAGCPFTKTSLGGWLGEYKSPQDLLNHSVQSEQHYPCHKTCNEEADTEEERFKGAQLCKGALMFALKSAKRYDNTDKQAKRDACKGEDLSNILTVPEFHSHHGR